MSRIPGHATPALVAGGLGVGGAFVLVGTFVLVGNLAMVGALVRVGAGVRDGPRVLVGSAVNWRTAVAGLLCAVCAILVANTLGAKFDRGAQADIISARNRIEKRVVFFIFSSNQNGECTTLEEKCYFVIDLRV